MLAKENFDLEHINMLRMQYKKDPSLLERVIYAFGLLEAIAKVDMPFVFKGGTCLMLLTEHPMRLSTDIDIIVEPGTDVDKYIAEASKLFPFKRYEEQTRVGMNKIEKRHFKFVYNSPIRDAEFYILLDIVFSEIPYVQTIQKEIRNDILLIEDKPLEVFLVNKSLEYIAETNIRPCAEKCNLCRKACPTESLEAPYMMCRNTCVSCLTTWDGWDLRKEPLQDKFGGWIYGCDPIKKYKEALVSA